VFRLTDAAVRLKNVISVPGLTKRMFSLSQYAHQKDFRNCKNFINLTFVDMTTISPLLSASRVAFNVVKKIHKQVTHNIIKIGKLGHDPLENLRQPLDTEDPAQSCSHRNTESGYVQARVP
jgi:hypothetical protein